MTAYKPWSERSEAERRECADAQRTIADFDDYPMTDRELAAFLGLPSVAAATRLVAEGRIHSRWASDVRRYRHRRDSQPIPGMTWPPTSTRVSRKSTETTTEDTEDASDDDMIADAVSITEGEE